MYKIIAFPRIIIFVIFTSHIKNEKWCFTCAGRRLHSLKYIENKTLSIENSSLIWINTWAL